MGTAQNGVEPRPAQEGDLEPEPAGSGMECSTEPLTVADTEDSSEAIDKWDVQSDDVVAQSKDGPLHSNADNTVNDEGSSGLQPVPNVDTKLLEWTRDYTGILTHLKEQAAALRPPSPAEPSRQTGFLNQFLELEQDMLRHVDSILSLLHTLTPSHHTSQHH